MCDALYTDNRFRTFNVIDDFNRECLAVEINTSITGKRLIRVFERLRSERGLPEVLRVDNGPEFLSGDFVAWAEQAVMAIRYIQPGHRIRTRMWRGSTGRTVKSSCACTCSVTLMKCGKGTHTWRLDYNERRPHDALGDLTPDEYRQNNTGNSTLKLST